MFSKIKILLFLSCLSVFCLGDNVRIEKEYYPDKKIFYRLSESHNTINYLIFNENQNVIKQINFDIFELPGTVKYFYPNGQIKKIEMWKNGQRYLSKFYSAAGNLLAEENWKNNKLHGLCKYYYPDGRIKLINEYNFDKLLTNKR